MRMMVTTRWKWNGALTEAQPEPREIGSDLPAEYLGEFLQDAIREVAASTTEFRAEELVLEVRFER